MRFLRNGPLILILLFGMVTLVIPRCGPQNINVQGLLNQPIEEIGNFNFSRKYIKAGVTVVYLTGSPYEIGLAHGTLCKREILEVNRQYFEYFNQFLDDSSDKWEDFSKELKKRIPQEYLEEMRGIRRF